MVGAQADVAVAVAVHALGPVRATRDGAELRLGGPRQRRLLAVLLIHHGAVVSVDRIAEAVFEGEPTEAAATTLRSYVARLRRVLGDDLVRTRAPGYQLVLAPGAFDVTAFEQGVEAAQAALHRQDPAGAAALVRRALATWQGEAYAEFADEPWAWPEAHRLAELRLTAHELLVDAELSCGHTAAVLPTVEALCREHPLREAFRAQLVTAYYRGGRQADALAELRAFRKDLAEELGIDPSPTLVELERRVLAQDPLLESPVELLRGYRLGERLGSGREGTVRAASLTGVERPLVIKTFRSQLADDPDFIRSFEATAHRVASLRHPAVLPLHDWWREPGAAHAVMPRLTGGTLRDRLARAPLTRPDLVALVERLGGALARAAAADLVHGRVTPENVLYDAAGDPVLADFWLGGAVVPAPEEDVRGLAGLVREAAGSLGADLDEVLAAPADGIERFVADLLAALGRPAGPARARNPYLGLRAFDESDQEYYYGRDGLVEEIAGRLTGTSRLVLLVGASGTGKSSAVRAGLLPRLRASAEAADWFVATMLPGGAPYAELAEALSRVAVLPVPAVDATLGGIDAAVRDGVPGELLLVLDQFEELFTLSPEQEQRTFLAALAHALTRPDSRLRVVATLRADYYDRPLAVQPFGSLVQDATVTIPAMLPAEVEAAVVEPAHRVGRQVDRSLAAELVGAVSREPAALPALQFVLYELAERGALTLASYRALGGLDGAIAARAEELYQALDDEDRQRVREMFERLVVVSEGEPTRRRATRDELAASAGVVDAWAAVRLLTLDVHPQTRVPTVEVAHEALVREWPRLREWIEADRSDLLVTARVRDAARAWDDLGRDPSALLRGTALEAALDVTARRSGVPALERAFVEESRLAAEGERQRQMLVIRRQARTNRRLRWQLGGIGVMLVLALVGGFVALDQRREATVIRHQAVARELAAAAEASLADDPERGMLLALAAIDATREHGEPVLAEATDALHRAVTTNRVVRTVTRTGAELLLTPDGRHLLARGRGARAPVEVRDLATGRVVRELPDDVDVARLGLSPDASLLAVNDDRLRVLDAATGRTVAEWEQAADRDAPPVFSPDGKYLATGAGHLRVYPVTGGPALLEVEEDEFEVVSRATFSPDGRRLVAVSNTDSETGSATVYDLRSGARDFRVDFGDVVLPDVGWSPDGRWIAVTGSAGQVYVVDAHARRLRLEASAGSGAVNSVAWSPDSRLLATGGDDGTVRVFGVSGSSLDEVQVLASQNLATGVERVAFGQDGAQVWALDFGRTAVKAWALTPAAAGEVLNVPTRRGAFDNPGAAFAPDGRSVWVLRPGDRTARHDVATGAEQVVLATPGLTPVKTDLLVSPDGGLFVTRMLGLLAERNVTVRSTATGKPVFRVPRADYSTEEVAWSKDGRHLAVVYVEETGNMVRVFDRRGRVVTSVATGSAVLRLGFADDDRVLVTVDPDDGIWVWDWRQGRLLRQLDTAAALLATADHDLVVTAPGQGVTAEVWDVRRGERVSRLTGHNGALRSLAWDPVRRRVATASEDGVVRVFDARTGRRLQALTAPGRAAARGLSFSPDGRRLVANYADGVARVWALDLDELIGIARSRVTRDLTDAECRQYLHIETCAEAGR